MDAIYGGRNGVLGNLRLNVGIYVQLVPLPEAADSASRAPLHLSAVKVIIRVRSEGKMEPTCRIAGSACMAQPEHQKTKIYRSALSAGAGS